VSSAFAIAKTRRYVLSAAHVLRAHAPSVVAAADRDGLIRVDILIDQGRIAAMAPSGLDSFGDAPRLALAGGIVLPLFVDAHTHLDKGNIWPRAANPTGVFERALATVIEDRAAHWTAADVAARMEFSLRAAYAHGVSAIRTHIDSVGPQTRISWPVLAEARERWRGRIELQASPLFIIDLALDPAHMADVEAMVGEHGSGILGAATPIGMRVREGLDVVFGLAERKGWDLDFHVDETADPAARSLGLIAEMALARKFQGRILVGHCCSLARQDDDEMRRTIDAVARAGISVVSLPMCNMFLQDRHAGRTPRWRGVTALHELRAAGVNVMIASDNTRDPFYAYGDLDMMEVWREGIRILHLDYPVADWAGVVFDAPARAIGVEAPVFRVGAPADMILTRARDFTELFARPQSDRAVLRAGVELAARAPDYSELDALEGLGR
jgi:cytosine/creatinine deaminase